jgi:mono/diheme cytochrome c family protein
MKHEPMAMPSTGLASIGNFETGRKIYQRLCASCHGVSGKGDGPVGRALNPKPSDFTEHTLHHEDEYFFKVIKEGGAAVGKAPIMPAWGGQLADQEIWDIISYLRTFAKSH